MSRAAGSFATFLGAGFVLLLSSCGGCAAQQVTMAPIAAGSFDDIESDQAGHRLFMADQKAHGIDVVDVSSGSPRFVGTVDLGATPNGLALAADRQLLYAGLDGGKVAVVDVDPSSPKSMHVVGTIATNQPTADLMDYNPSNGWLYVGTGEDGHVVGVDTRNKQVVDSYNLKTAVEQPRFDPADGMLYVTTPGTNTLHQLDPRTGKETRKYVIDRCRPGGLAINPNRQMAMLACRGSMATLNLRNGAYAVTRAVPGADIVSYDAGADRFVMASPHGKSDSSLGVFDGDGQFLASVNAAPNSHTAVFDDGHGLVYAPGPAGLMSFAPASCEPPPDWLTFLGKLSVFALPFAALALFLFWYARRPPRPGRKTFEQLQAEDLAMERERMRALEDAIYGPAPTSELET